MAIELIFKMSDNSLLDCLKNDLEEEMSVCGGELLVMEYGTYRAKAYVRLPKEYIGDFKLYVYGLAGLYRGALVGFVDPDNPEISFEEFSFAKTFWDYVMRFSRMPDVFSDYFAKLKKKVLK